MASYPDSNFVGSAVVNYLTEHNIYPNTEPKLTDPVQIRHATWSTLFFITLTLGDSKKKIVAKIPRFPDQELAETSWESDELVDRGYREYDALLRIYNHFEVQPDKHLRAVRPIAFLPETNTLVMDYIEGELFYTDCMQPRRIAAPGGRKRAEALMYRTGQWLHAFHKLSEGMGEGDRISDPPTSLTLLLEHIQRLNELGVNTSRWNLWDKTLAALQKIDSSERVWIHSDFHMRNVFVLPDESILGFDTALDKQDNLYMDIGNFLADMRTRRSRILNFGLLPSTKLLQTMHKAFLKGYLQNQTPDSDLLLLYEGRFIFQKWEESLLTLQEKMPKQMAPAAKALCDGVINPTFHRIAHQWMQAVLDKRPIW